MVTRTSPIALLATVTAALAFSACVHAQSTLRFEKAVIEPGGTTDLLLTANVDGDVAFGVNIAFDLPSGITLVDVAPGIMGAEDISTDSFVASGDGIENARVLAYSTTASIEDSSGVVLRITLQATEELSVLGISSSETYDAPILITASGLVGSDLQTSVLHTAESSILTIKGPDSGPEGDVNGDGNVSAVDVQLVINAVLAGGSSNPANDINGDGSVDAVDIQLVINFVLGVGKDTIPAPVEIDAPSLQKKIVRVLPSLPPLGGTITIGLEDYLYIRLRADTHISLDSITGLVESGSATSTNVGWLPISPSDGWAVYAPEYPWAEGEMVTFRSSAMTVSGEQVQSETYRFYANEDSNDASAVPQPLVYEPSNVAADGFVTVRALSQDNEIEKLTGAITPAYYVAPGQVFSTPQRVWLPLADPNEAQQLGLYVYLPEETEKKWHPASTVEGFLAESEATLLEYEGRIYYGVLVNFGAVVTIAR